jgi:hypothetical protein
MKSESRDAIQTRWIGAGVEPKDGAKNRRRTDLS